MKKDLISILLVLLLISFVFFYQMAKGYVPFPGDLLVSTSPYNTNSYLGYAPGGVPNKGQDGDVMHQMYPWKYFTINSLKQGQIPFWTPYNFSGTPLMANFQSGVFYPLNIIFFLLPFVTSWSIYIFISPFLASFFLFLFLRESGLSKLASVFGGVVFAFSSYMVVWMEYGNITHTFMWLPLILYFTKKYTTKPRLKYIALMVLSLCFSFLAGYIQGFFYLFIITIFYFLTQQNIFIRKNLFKVTVYFIALLSPLLLCLFQLLPTLELFSLSSRNPYSLSQITALLNPWWYIITILFSDFFGNPASRNFWFTGTYIERVSYFGVIPFLLAFAAATSFRTKEIKLWTILGTVSLLLSLDLFVTRYLYLLPIPILSTTVPTRILSIFAFSGSVLAGYGLDAFQKGILKRNMLFSSILSIVALLIVWVFAVFGNRIFIDIQSTSFSVTKHNIILPSFLIIVFLVCVFIRFFSSAQKNKKVVRILGYVLVVAMIIDLFYFFQKITPFSPTIFIYPKTSVISYLQSNDGINRFWGYNEGSIDPNFQTYDKTYSPNGLDALHIRTYSEFISASNNGSIGQVSRDSANIISAFDPTGLRGNGYRQKALNILGIKYVLNKNEELPQNTLEQDNAFPMSTYKLLWQDVPWQIYTNKKAVPRVFLTNSYEVIKDPYKQIQTFYSSNFNEAKTLILSQDPQLPSSNLSQHQVTILNYQPNYITLKTNTNAKALLFLSDNNFPGWHVAIDGKQDKIYTADYTFRAIVVPSGLHTVSFWYYPQSFVIGLWLSAFFFVFGIIGGAILKAKKYLN